MALSLVRAHELMQQRSPVSSAMRPRARRNPEKEKPGEEDEMHTEAAHTVLLEPDHTVTGLYTGVRHSGKRWSIPRTTFM